MRADRREERERKRDAGREHCESGKTEKSSGVQRWSWWGMDDETNRLIDAPDVREHSVDRINLKKFARTIKV